jgi:putative ABC transport system permease protein
MATHPRPPRAARWIATRFTREGAREFLLGDLEEEFLTIAARRGRIAAGRHYWRQALQIGWQALSDRDRVRVPAEPRRGGRIDVASLKRDLVLGARAIRRSPGYSAVMVLTLALAIGANTLLFSIANPLLVRPLPVADQATLGWVMSSNAEREIQRGGSSMPDFLEWRAGMTTFAGLAAYELGSATLTGQGDARRILTSRVTANLFDVWGVRPFDGRLFRADDETPGAPLAGVVSYRFWREAFQGDRSAIGRVLVLDGKPITIVGVAPASLEIGNLTLIDVWAPATLDPTSPRDRRGLRVVGRLAPGITIEQADADLQRLVAGQAREHVLAHRGWEIHVRPTLDAVSGSDTWIILGLLGVIVVFILLIACANLSNLVMARLVNRRQESSLQLALGASRWQLIRPLLVEGFLLAIAGGVLGLLIADGGVQILRAMATEPFLRNLEIDRYVLIFTAGLALVTPFLFALWPALTAGRAAAIAMLPGARATGRRDTARRRDVLVALQVTLALSLTIVAALVVQSMINLRRIDIGYDVRPLLSWRLDLPAARYPDDAARAAYIDRVESAMTSLPGVTGAALATHLPVIEGDQARAFSGTRRDGTRESERPWASCFKVSPAFFGTMGLTVLAGRPFQPADRAETEAVAVLNRLAAEKYFDRLDEAVGRTVVVHDPTRGDRPVRIVGVVSDTRDSQLTRSSPQLYLPLSQWPVESLRAVLRSTDPVGRAGDVQALLRQMDPEVPVSELKGVTAWIAEERASEGIINGLFVAFAVLALALAAAGLFGVVSYSVGQRRREIGIRLALGASPRAIAGMVMAGGFKVVAIGMIAGVVLGWLIASATRSLLYGVTPTDPATFLAVAGMVAIVTAIATWHPAARAMRVDPARTLRAE